MRPGIVHRIDKETSGLIVAAKNDLAHIALSEQIKAHTCERVYRAIIRGRLKIPPAPSGHPPFHASAEAKGGKPCKVDREEIEFTIDAPIGRHPHDRVKMAVVPSGREAVTHVRLIEELDGFSHVECRLETGRTHQIRVHMAHVGHPVAGDAVYGGKREMEWKDTYEYGGEVYPIGQMLHAKKLAFDHPRSGERIVVESELPGWFERVLERVKLDR